MPSSSELWPSDGEIFERGKKPSVVESFAVRGLYGYRSVSLESEYAATVLIAKNGSGKTTLLGALDAFLKGQFSRLRGLNFTEITCKLRGNDRELVLRREDVVSLFDIPPDGEIARFARKIEADVSTLSRFLSEDFELYKDDYRYLHEETIFASIQRSVGYRFDDAVSLCEKLLASLLEGNIRLKSIKDDLRRALHNTEIVYLPTFRRVELPLVSNAKDPSFSKRKRPKFQFSEAASLFTGDIQFGLGDILERLSELNQSILADSNLGYRQTSANIINELIDGTFERGDFAATHIPDKDELNLFFSRIREGRKVLPFGEVTIPNIEKLYSNPGDITSETRKTLRYFLSKLDTVIKTTRDTERTVEDFILNCNKYLSSQDLSTSLPEIQNHVLLQAGDEKVLRLNRRNLDVYAESLSSGKKIPLDSLSSGEKQMVSLFAKLFLYPKQKILLIDEPELSLSIDWQKHILADVIGAPMCRQLIAITHSPFVFDNALEPFARALQLAIDLEAAVRPDVDDRTDVRD